MSKFDSMWKFASDHPIISFLIADVVVTGAVNLTRAITKPFVKTPEYSVADVVNTVMRKLDEDEKKPEAAVVDDISEVTGEPAKITAC